MQAHFKGKKKTVNVFYPVWIFFKYNIQSLSNTSDILSKPVVLGQSKLYGRWNATDFRPPNPVGKYRGKFHLLHSFCWISSYLNIVCLCPNEQNTIHVSVCMNWHISCKYCF